MKIRIRRILCLALSAILLLSPVSDSIATQAAAATVYQLSTLLSEGKIKPLGRTQAGGSGILADWSGAGFEINVSGDGGTMTVGYKASYAAYWAILIDGVQTQRIYAANATGGSSFSFTVPAGKHTVSVVKDTEISTSETAYYDLTTLSFAGQIEAAPANKDLYIEFIGDSYSCGDGAAGAYEPGAQAWVAVNHAATKGFPWYTAKTLNADYSIVARGGIGLFVGISEQEGTANKKGMQDIYKYTSGYRASAGEYSFTRQPDIVVVELGANDGISASDAYKTIEYWTSLLEDFTDQVRAKNPNASIVFLSHNAVKHKAMMSVVEARKATDPKLHAFFFAHNGNGSAALATQYDGHPDADDQKQLSDALVNYLKYTDIVPVEAAAPTYKDIPYYVSASGSDTNNGTAIGTAKATIQAALDQARADTSAFADNSRVVINVQGSVSLANALQTIAVGQLLGVSGKKVPVLIQTYNYSGTKAVIDTGNAPVNDAAAAIVFGNDVTLKNITLQATTAASGYRDRYLYAGYNDVVLDNVTFATAGSTPANGDGWIVSAGHPTGANAPTAITSSSVTFQNGDYTNLARVATVQTASSAVSALSTVDCRIIVEDGAKMGTVYNRCGSTVVKSATVDIQGGTVAQYVGTASGTTNSRITYTGNIDFIMSGGAVYGSSFATTGKYATINGNINTTVSGGKIYITPQSSTQYDAYLFGGGQASNANDVNTTISGGTFYLVTNVASVDSGFYFGPSGGGTVRNVTNTISNASFLPMAGTAATSHVNIYMGAHLGSITGTLRNEIISGTFSFDAASATGVVDFNTRGVNWPIGKVVNILGAENSLQGPRFLNCPVRLGGYWAQVGVSTKATAEPAASDCTDTVVLSNTIYGGYFNNAVYCSTTNQSDASKSRYSFIKGSIENKVYSGHFLGNYVDANKVHHYYGLIAGGNVNVYGRVTTDVYGGIFTNIYGDNLANTIYDGVALNIHGVDSYAPVKADNTWKIHVAGSSYITTQTAGRDALVLTLDGTTPLNLNIPTATYSSKITGTTRLVLKNAIVDDLPTGFAETDIALDADDVLTLRLNQPLKVNNVSGTGTIVFDRTNSLTVLDSATGKINCVLPNGSVGDYTYITAPANTANDAFTFAQDTGVRPSASGGKQWTTGEVVYEHVSITAPSGNRGYDTLAEAVAAYTGEENSYIVLWEDIADPVTVSKPIYLDLNGHKATVNLTGAGAVYGMDTSGNDYQLPTGVLTVTGGTAQSAAQVTTAKGQFCYLAIANGQQYTFHRIGLGVRKGLRPNNETYGIGLYYSPYYQADEALAALINADESCDYGLYVAIDKGADPIGDYHSFRSLIPTLNEGRTDTSYRAVIYDLMPTNEQYKTKQAQNGDDGSSMTNAEFLKAYDLSKYTVIAQAYLQIGDVYLMGSASSSISLRDAVVAADRLYSDFSEDNPSKLAMDSMWSRYSKVMGTWFSDMDGDIDAGLTNFGNIIVDISGWFK